MKWRATAPELLGAGVRPDDTNPVVLSWWFVEAIAPQGDRQTQVISLAISSSGSRVMPIERLGERVLDRVPTEGFLNLADRKRFMGEYAEPALQREIQHRGLLTPGGSFSADLIGWIEIGV